MALGFSHIFLHIISQGNWLEHNTSSRNKRNKDFRGKPVHLHPPVLMDRPMAGFRYLDGQMLSTIPLILKLHVEGYFTLRMGIEQRAVVDSQAGNADVASNWVEACSYYLPASHEEGSTLNMIYHSSLGQYLLILNDLESALY